MRSWIEPEDVPVSPALLEAAGGDLLVARALARRGYGDPAAARAFLDPDLYVPAQPEELPDLERAVERLRGAVREAEKILVWGDFDVDGQTATALLVDTLRELGGMVEWHIPVRAEESHGVSPAVLKRYLDDPQRSPGLVLTCDTGIAAFSALEMTRQAGIDMIITDHHQLPRAEMEPERTLLPDAFAVVTPRLLAEGHPMSGLPGVGVAYQLAEALYRAAGRAEGVERHLDLVALGIVADVALQTGDTRYLLQRGLELLKRTERAGLLALYERAELVPERLNEEQIGFILAPRLNALGRLSDANKAVDLLITQDRAKARLLALELEGLNSRRQLLTSQVFQAAIAQIEREPHLLDDEALVLAHPAWPAGVIGIVASKLVELYGKPAVLISAPAGETGRGSARSIDGVDITAAIAAQGEILRGFGGHAMAAGFSIEPERIDEFRRRLSKAVAVQLSQLPTAPAVLPIEARLAWQDPSLELAQSLERLAPFGPGNPPLVFASAGLKLANSVPFGRQKEHLQLVVEDVGGLSRRVIWWGGGDLEKQGTLPQSEFELAYTLRASSYRGQMELTILYEDLRVLESAIDITRPQRKMEILDFRGLKDPLKEVAALTGSAAPEDCQIWAEGAGQAQLRQAVSKRGAGGLPGLIRSREGLTGCKTLVIWNAPPGQREFREGWQKTQAERIALVLALPDDGSSQTFLNRLAGLAKYLLRTPERQASLLSLAGAAGQNETAVRLGLEWLQASGVLEFSIQSSDLWENAEENGGNADWVRVSPGRGRDPQMAAVLFQQIEEVLEETRAFRKYLLRAAPEDLRLILE